MNDRVRRGGTGKRWSFKLVDDQDLAQATRYSLAAAEYHFDGLRFHADLLKDAPFEGGKLEQESERNFNKFYHYLRAFFWELYAASDTLFQEINRRLGLAIPEREVTWDKVSLELSKRPEYGKFLKKLSKGYNSTWFTEVREFRNFAHRGTLLIEAFGAAFEFRPEDGVRFDGMFLRPVSDGRGAGEPVELCRNYGRRVTAFIQWALDDLDRIKAR